MDLRLVRNRIPFIQAMHYRAVNPGRHIQLIVLHSMESQEKGDTAENVAKWFARGADGNAVSAHYCIDADSIVQCVQTKDIAFAAPSANRNGIHLELAGRARQDRNDWTDEYSKAVLDNAAALCALVLMPKYNILPVFLKWKRLADTKTNTNIKGLTTHAECSKVFGGTHWDPGPGFPEDYFLEAIMRVYQEDVY